MSVPPPPGELSGLGGFFAVPSAAPAPPSGPPAPPGQYGYAAPAGYPAPMASFGAPRAVTAPAATAGRVPELVTVAATLLGVFAAIGLYVGLAVLTVSSTVSAFADGVSDGTGAPHLGTYGVVWGLGGLVNVALVVFLRRGNPIARIVASVICGCWAIYWLHVLQQVSSAYSGATSAGFGSIVGVTELIFVALAAVSVLPAAVLWLPSTKQHFG